MEFNSAFKGLIHSKPNVIFCNFFPMAQQPLVGQALFIMEASRSHTNTIHSVGIFWTSDQCDAQTSTSQHSQQTDNHAPVGIRIRNSSNRATADSRLRLRDNWDRLSARTELLLSLNTNKIIPDIWSSRLRKSKNLHR